MTAKEWIGLRRDRKAQRLVELVVIVAGGELGSVTGVDAATNPTFKRNNIGCWGYADTASRTDRQGSWSSGSIVVRSTLRVDHSTRGGQTSDAATGRLRVPIAAAPFRSAGWTLAEAYTEGGCSCALNQSGTGPVERLDGNLAGSRTVTSGGDTTTWVWNLAPLREP